MNERLMCRHCGDVIGTYEPMIVVIDGRVHATSILAERDREGPLGEHYHEACYAQLTDQATES